MAADVFPQIISIGKLLSFEQALLPFSDNTQKVAVVGVADNCRIHTENGKEEFDQMVWIGNERLSVIPGEETVELPFRRLIPDSVIVYRGKALNPNDINGLPPHNHRGVWLRRGDIRFEANE